MPELQVLNGSLQWKTIPLSGARFLIGRKDTCHLVLKDGWVSREHTLIMEPKAGEFRVQDLDSENGTFLNGERIRDIPMKHGDILKVGRTEMRFMQHAGATPPSTPLPPHLQADTSSGLRTQAESRAVNVEYGPQTIKVDATSQTAADDVGTAKSDAPRIDLRERVRRLEARLLDGEQANAALAAENSVLKRALARLGVMDRTTGAIDPSKLTPLPQGVVPDAMLRFVTNPLARVRFPGAREDGVATRGNSNPALFELGLVGIDSLGIKFAECVSRLGYRRAVAITAERDAMRGGVIDPAWRIYVDRPKGTRPAAASRSEDVFLPAMPRIEETFAEAFAGADRVMLCADASAPLAADGLNQLGEVVRRAGGQAGAVVFFDPAEDHVEWRGRAEAALAAARTLSESGRLAPVIVIDLARASQSCGSGQGDASAPMLDSVAGALDGLLRLAIMPAVGAPVSREAVLEVILAKGWSTLGFAAAEDVSRAAIQKAFTHALGPGLLAQAMPASRSRAAFVAAVVGADLITAESELDAARAIVSSLLPQAQRVEALYHDAGDSVRVIAFVGGLPCPETFFGGRSSVSERREQPH